MAAKRKKTEEALTQYTAMTANDRLAAVREGWPIESLSKTAEQFGIGLGELNKIVGLAPATLARRKVKQQCLPTDVSERLDRLYDITSAAARVLGGSSNARCWMTQTNPMLAGSKPIEMVGTEIEGQQVRCLLTSIEWGTGA